MDTGIKYCQKNKMKFAPDAINVYIIFTMREFQNHGRYHVLSSYCVANIGVRTSWALTEPTQQFCKVSCIDPNFQMKRLRLREITQPI